jgi:hypothetical protein
VALPFSIDPGLVTGVCGILAGLICLVALRGHRIAAAKVHAELRSMVREQEAEWSGRIEQLDHRMAAFELRVQSVDDAAKGGLTHSVRTRALQLLQSGMSVESVASTLGIGRREMRLIARVSRTLTLR